MADQEAREALDSAIASGNAIVCYAKCWPCQFGQCYDPPKPHPWWDDEDVEHCKATGRKPPEGNCACVCAGEAGQP